MGWMTQIC